MLADEEFGSDTDDEDYVPEGEGHEASEEEHSGDEEQPTDDQTTTNSKTRKKKRGSKNQNIFGRPNCSDSTRGWEEDLSEEKREKEAEKQKKKADELWADFKSDTGPKHRPSSVNTGGSASTIAGIFSEPSSSNPSSGADDSTTKIAAKPVNRLSSLFDTVSPKSVDKKEECCVAKPKSRLSSLFDDDSTETSAAKTEGSSNNTQPSDGQSSNSVEITKVFDFAGETVKVTEKVDADSNAAKKFLKSQKEDGGQAVKRTSGLANVVGSIGKKPKMGCLDKSKLDWNQFVEAEGIKEELSSHNRGKHGYVEKQMFLERADLRQFELEKAVRDKTRKSFMK